MTAIIAARLDSRSRNWPYAITLTFTADRYVHTFDPPYRGETSAITGRYELLADSRILFEHHPDGARATRWTPRR